MVNTHGLHYFHKFSTYLKQPSPFKVPRICAHYTNLPPGLVDTPSCQPGSPALSLPLANHVTYKSLYLSTATASSHLHSGTMISPPLPARDDVRMTEDSALRSRSHSLFSWSARPHWRELRAWGRLAVICEMPAVRQGASWQCSPHLEQPLQATGVLIGKLKMKDTAWYYTLNRNNSKSHI